MKTKTFKISSCTFEENQETSEIIFHLGGRDDNGKSVHCKIVGFTPHVYLELPENVKWTMSECQYLIDALPKYIKPESWERVKRSCLYYLRPAKCLLLRMPNKKSMYGIAKHFLNPFEIEGVGKFKAKAFKVHEHNIDPILKFGTERNIQFANWVKVRYEKPCAPFSSCDISLIVDWKNIEFFENLENGIPKQVPPKIMSFDIEAYSNNHNSRLSDPTVKENIAFQIACLVGLLGDPIDSYKKVLLTMYHPEKINNANEVRKFETEKDLLLGFSELIRGEIPDAFVGYNTMKFDWNYLVIRAKRPWAVNKKGELTESYLDEFLDFARLENELAEVKVQEWRSGAYGVQKFSYISLHGSIQVDVLLEIERNFKLPNYTLNTVSEFFLREKKHDISARQMFMIVALTQEFEDPKWHSETWTDADIKRFHEKVYKCLVKRYVSGDVALWKIELLKTKTLKDFGEVLRRGIELVGEYCIQDTILPIRLMEKLNLWKGMEAMTNTCHVPMSYLHTRGQQIKVLSLVYRTAFEEKVFIPFIEKKKNINSDEKFQGAVVDDAEPSDSDNVASLDFASLYPSIMLLKNICYTTIVTDDDPISDELCNVIGWEEHDSCPHDTKKRKTKRKVPLCGKHRYRFKKVQIDDEGNVHGEGLMIKLLRKLLGLRKVYKKQMFEADAMVSMNRGQATEKDLNYFRKIGLKIVNKGELPDAEFKIWEDKAKVLNAMQLAVKVSCNSVHPKTPILCLIDNLVQYVEMENLFNTEEMIEDEEGNQVCEPVYKNAKVWSEQGWTAIKYVIRHRQRTPLIRVCTNTGCVDATEEHSLLDKDGNPLKTIDVKKGTELLHHRFGGFSNKLVGGFIINEWFEEGKNFNNFDNNFQEKIIYVMNADYETRLSFFSGYYHTYGKELEISDDDEENVEYISCETEMVAAVMMFICQSLGYVPWLDAEEDGSYTIWLYMGKDDIDGSCQVETLRKLVFQPGTFIYDIETENHHFAAGVGNMIVHNSCYGTLGAKTGFIPLLAGAASVTAIGRTLKTKSAEYILENYDSKLIYGDSVAGHMPLTLRNGATGEIIVKTIEELVSKEEWEKTPIINGKQHFEPNRTEQWYEAWTEKGWTPILNVMRHRRDPKKKMFRIDTCSNGFVEVTEDHSLVDDRGQMIKPGELRKNESRLLCAPFLIPTNNASSMCRANGYISAPNDKLIQQIYIDLRKSGVECYIGGFRVQIGHPVSDRAKRDVSTVHTIREIQEYIIEAQKREKGINYDYVYDLTTENHHFQAGVGCIIVHNTDSVLMSFAAENINQAFDIAEKASNACTHFLKCYSLDFDEKRKFGKNQKTMDKITEDDLPSMALEERKLYKLYSMSPLDLEFENMYGRFILLSKKRYLAYIMNRLGEVLKEVKKGILPARRDNTRWARILYMAIGKGMLDRVSDDELIRILCEYVLFLFNRKMKEEDLIIYKAVSEVVNYAKKKKIKFINDDGENEEAEVFISLIDQEAFDDPVSWEDPRLDYSRAVAHAKLALKMNQRGDIVPPNTRLEYVFLETAEKAKLQAEKMEDYTYFRENRLNESGKEVLKLDKLYYFEKQIIKPLTELLNIRFMKKPMLAYFDLEEHIVCEAKTVKSLIHLTIIDNVARGKAKELPADKIMNFVLSNGCPTNQRLEKLCETYRRRKILERMIPKYKPFNRPTSNYGNAIRLGIRVRIFKFGTNEEETVDGKVVERVNVSQKLSKQEFLFDVVSDDGKRYNKIQRVNLGVLYRQDGRMLEHMLEYHTNFLKVVREIKDIFG